MHRSNMRDAGYMKDADCRHNMGWHRQWSLNDGRLPPVRLDSAFEGASAPSAPAADDADPRKHGRALVADIGCQQNHQIGADGGRFGPLLNGVVARKGDAFVRSKLENPKVDNSYSNL